MPVKDKGVAQGLVRAVRTVTRPPTWRPQSLRFSYVFTREETDATQTFALYRWAIPDRAPRDCRYQSDARRM